MQYEGGQVHLKDIVDSRKHDDVLGQIEAKKVRYQRTNAKGKCCFEEPPNAVNEADTLDRTVLTVSPAEYRQFLARLNAPPRPNKRLIKSMHTPAPWE